MHPTLVLVQAQLIAPMFVMLGIMAPLVCHVQQAVGVMQAWKINAPATASQLPCQPTKTNVCVYLATMEMGLLVAPAPAPSVKQEATVLEGTLTSLSRAQ